MGTTVLDQGCPNYLDQFHIIYTLTPLTEGNLTTSVSSCTFLVARFLVRPQIPAVKMEVNAIKVCSSKGGITHFSSFSGYVFIPRKATYFVCIIKDICWGSVENDFDLGGECCCNRHWSFIHVLEFLRKYAELFQM